jgi:heterotetrameric sarcosine oxidase gamma subunit
MAVKLTPLHSTTQRLGAQFIEVRGWHIPEVYSSTEAEVESARQGIALGDDTANGRLTIQSPQAEAVVQAALDAPSLTIGAGAAAAASRVYRLRQDLFFISTPPGEEQAAQEKLSAASAAAGHFATVADITHGRAEIRLVGPASQAFLSKVCSLNFASGAFPDGTAKQSSLARTNQLIIRRDAGSLPGFSIIGKRSLGLYVWDVISQAGHEWGLTPIGRVALDVLEEK